MPGPSYPHRLSSKQEQHKHQQQPQQFASVLSPGKVGYGAAGFKGGGAGGSPLVPPSPANLGTPRSGPLSPPIDDLTFFAAPAVQHSGRLKAGAGGGRAGGSGGAAVPPSPMPMPVAPHNTPRRQSLQGVQPSASAVNISQILPVRDRRDRK